MSNQVYANGREISCKSAGGKAPAAFPDVCFTPPENPATPPGVPIPYPNTGMSSDATSGSKSVKITGKEVMLKDVSYFKKSMGDEAGCAAKKGILTSVHRGKVYFTSWSMDVKIEGENADRHVDMTTHNHASLPNNTPPWAYLDEAATEPIPECQGMHDQKRAACEDRGLTTPQQQCDDEACRQSKKCFLVSYGQGKSDSTASTARCCPPDDQPHHLVEVHCFTEIGGRTEKERLRDFPNYDDRQAPCVCASGEGNGDGEHALMHSVQDKDEKGYAYQRNDEPLWAFGSKPNDLSYWTYEEARETGVKAHKRAFPDCDENCIRAQLDGYHVDELEIDPQAPVRTDRTNRR